MTDLTVQVHANADDEQQDLLQLTRQLRTALLDLDVDAVDPLAPTAAPDGAKGGNMVATLGIKLGGVALKKAIDKIREWISRNGRSVEVTIDGDTIKLTGATAAQQEQLLHAWLVRHAPRS
ncbi:MAG: hypothetical protein JXA67_22055 [Micromonosporaceae bacterium]|nr:hypothetical protein [Micromonosporaceae bacterium]